MKDVVIAGQTVVWCPGINTVISIVYTTNIGCTKQVIPIHISQKGLICCLEGALQNTRVVEISLEKLNTDRAADHQQKQK
jgi:hypothetical protein